MAAITRFEDIESWKEARILTGSLYELCRSKPLASDYGLCDQLRRAGVSVMANIAEGFGRDGNKEFIQFLSNAKGSASELKSHFYVLLDANFIDQTKFEELYQRANFIEILIAKLIDYLKTSEIRGRKFDRT